MGLLDFVGRKVDEMADQNADHRIRELGLDVSKIPENVRLAAKSGWLNIQQGYCHTTGEKPFNIAECTLIKLSFIYFDACISGKQEIRQKIALIVPLVEGPRTGRIRGGVSGLAADIVRNGMESLVTSEQPAPVEVKTNQKDAGAMADWGAYDRPAVQRHRH